MWLMPVVAVAPCQCFSPGRHMTTSPARISLLGPPQHCTQPQPAVTISLWPSGWACHAVRAPGSNVTNAAETREGSVAWNSGSIRTLPLKYSAGPLAEDCEPLRLSSMFSNLSFYGQSRGLGPLVNLIPHAMRSPQRVYDIAAASPVVLVRPNARS